MRINKSIWGDYITVSGVDFAVDEKGISQELEKCIRENLYVVKSNSINAVARTKSGYKFKVFAKRKKVIYHLLATIAILSGQYQIWIWIGL